MLKLTNEILSKRASNDFLSVLKEDMGETISCVGYIGRVEMKQTDKEIVRLMLKG